MADINESPSGPRPRHEEFDDPHYHDDDETPAVDDSELPKAKTPPKRRAMPRWPQRRFEDD